jgi:hypothetical protein
MQRHMALLLKTFFCCALAGAFAASVPLFAGDPVFKTALEAAAALALCMVAV